MHACLIFHKSPDIEQLHTCVTPGCETVLRQKFTSCISNLMTWCASRWPKFNASKTELIWFGSHIALRKMIGDQWVTVDSVHMQPTDIVCDLGVLLDSELTMKQHITNKVDSACFYHLFTGWDSWNWDSWNVTSQCDEIAGLSLHPQSTGLLQFFWMDCPGRPLLYSSAYKHCCTTRVGPITIWPCQFCTPNITLCWLSIYYLWSSSRSH